MSIAEIAHAGIGKGTVFRHFATKEDLIAAIMGDVLDKLVTTPCAAPPDVRGVGYVERTLRTMLGHLSVSKINARILETFYAVRRCQADQHRWVCPAG